MTEGITTPGAGWRRADGPPAQKREKRRRRRGGGRPGGEVAMVEEAEFTSYYGRPIIKPPVWKTPDVPLYLFLGGAAGSSSIMAALADLTDRPALTRNARYVSGGAAIASVVFLIHDLGRPQRFLHMLRVIKVTSPRPPRRPPPFRRRRLPFAWTPSPATSDPPARRQPAPGVAIPSVTATPRWRSSSPCPGSLYLLVPSRAPSPSHRFRDPRTADRATPIIIAAPVAAAFHMAGRSRVVTIGSGGRP